MLPNLSTVTLSESITTHSTKSYLDHKPMGILYYDKELHPDKLHQIKIRLYRTFTYTRIFNDLYEFTSYLISELIAQKIIFIICSKLAESVYDLVKERPQCYRVYILQLEHKLFEKGNVDACRLVSNSLDEQFSQTINSSADHYRSSLDTVEDKMIEELSSIDVFNSKSFERSFRYLSSESLKFLLFQSCCQVLLNMNHDRGALKEMLYICRRYYMKDETESKKIDDFADKYSSALAISYYTRDSFVFRQVNQAFRSENIEQIFKFRVYITDLHRQIAEDVTIIDSHLHLYRGKKLSTVVLQQLFDNKKKLISMNGFVSTTRNIEVAKFFAGIGQNREGYQSALFELCIDGSTKLRCMYADVTTVSRIKAEQEILFSIGCIWFLETMEWNDSYWIIKLRLSNELDSQLTEFRNQTNGDSFLSMGNILRELGEYSNAKNFYRRMLKEDGLDNETCGRVYYNMGLLADEQSEYMEALDNYLEAERKCISTTAIPNNSQESSSRAIYAHNHLPSRLLIWNNIGRSYEKKGDYENARMYYTKALAEESDPVGKAITYNNLGLLEYLGGRYEEACRCFTDAVELGKDHKLIQDFQQNLNIVNDHFRRAAGFRQ